MADLGALGSAGLTSAGAGPFSRLARTQYGALSAMRWRMLINSLRSNTGVFELGARTISYLIYSVMGLGLGVGAGAIAYMLVSRRMWPLLPIEFWIVFLIWQMVPVALASFQEQFDMSGLLRYPVNFGSFYLLFIVFGLFDISTLLGGLCCLGIFCGIALVRLDLAGWTVLGLMGFAVFNVLLVRTIFAWIDRWLAQRRTREIVSGVFLLFLVSLQLLNPALRQERHQGQTSQMTQEQRAENEHKQAAKYAPWLKIGNEVQRLLPPGLAAIALGRAARQEPGTAIVSLGVLGLYVLGTGGLLALRLRGEYRGESLGEAPSRKKVEQKEKGWLLNGSGPISAVIEKELRTLLRSMPQLYALGVPMFMVFIIGNLFRSGVPGARHPFQLALPVCVAYGLLGFTQLIYNSLGGEGKGIQLYFLSPTPIRTILLAKNLFHALLFCIVALVSGILATLRLGQPDLAVIAATVGWLLFALPADLAAGNVLSITMPYRVNLGRIGRQSGSQANGLLSLLIQTSLLGVGAAVIGLSTLYDRIWLATPILLLLACVSIFAWFRVLGHADALANERRDLLIGKLAKTE